MQAQHPDSSRQRLLDAAAALISADADQNVSVREICARAGVQLPTLYHFFESKRGLIDAVIAEGFSLLERDVVAALTAVRSDDPFDELAALWDAHVAFGRTNPSFYVLMYGRVAPRRRAPGSVGHDEQIEAVVAHAAARGMLAVPVPQAAERILVALTGLTLHLISEVGADPTLTATVQTALERSIRHLATPRPAPVGAEIAVNATALLGSLRVAAPDSLGRQELALLRKWLEGLGARA